MTLQPGPYNRGQCAFTVIPTDPLSATSSIEQCVGCVKKNNPRIESYAEDLQQIAFLTIIEETPKYDPDHPSGASYTTFIKAKVCTRLWKERQSILRDIPFSHTECPHGQNSDKNPLLYGLIAEACMIENIADNIIEKIEIETLKKKLPKLMQNLSKKEQMVINMKFFQENTGVEIAENLSVSEGRVSQITKNALAKIGKAYIATLDTEKGNPYRNT